MEKVTVWGTGKAAREFYYQFRGKCEIVCFYDNDESKQGTNMYGIPVKKYSGMYLAKIVIASSFLKEIVPQLLEAGLKPFEHFVLAKHFMGEIDYEDLRFLSDRSAEYIKGIFNKKIAVVYGNCQTGVLEAYLRKHKNFSNDYCIVHIPRVYEYACDLSSGKVLEFFVKDKAFLENVDLFIFQSVSRSNRWSEILNTDDILSKLSKNCQRVHILNLYFKGYFPQMQKNRRNICEDLQQFGLFTMGDKYIDRMLDDKEPVEEILREILREDFLTASEIEQNIKESLEELEFREKECDVKIVDFIKDYYREEQLFYFPSHPNEKLMLEYMNRIIEYLGYSRRNISQKDYLMLFGSLKGIDMPIYPSVIKYLGLTEYETLFYPNRYMTGFANMVLNITDYLSLYTESVQALKK